MLTLQTLWKTSTVALKLGQVLCSTWAPPRGYDMSRKCWWHETLGTVWKDKWGKQH